MSNTDSIQRAIDDLLHPAASERIAKIRQAQPDIDLLVSAYVARAALTGRLQLAAGDRPALTPERSTIDHWRQLLSQLQPSASAPPPEPDALTASLLDRLPFYSIELSLINRIGPHLPRILGGHDATITLDLLFKDDLMTRWYRDGVTFQVFYQQIEAALQAIMRNMGRPLRILEVGAGTGGLTFHLQNLLAANGADYTFTDTSRYFLRLARNNFPSAGFRYHTFDLERDHREASLPAETFDVVLASNVLHDTMNIDFALTNIRSLLKPGGYLIALEVVKLPSWWTLCFGSLEGWYRYKRDPTDRRRARMILTDDEWLSCLTETGYVGGRNVSHHALPDFANCVLVAQKKATQP